MCVESPVTEYFVANPSCLIFVKAANSAFYKRQKVFLYYSFPGLDRGSVYERLHVLLNSAVDF